VTFALAVLPTLASAADKPSATIYKTPNCGCCEQYADYMRQNGFEITVKPTHARVKHEGSMITPLLPACLSTRPQVSEVKNPNAFLKLSRMVPLLSSASDVPKSME